MRQRYTYSTTVYVVTVFGLLVEGGLLSGLLFQELSRLNFCIFLFLALVLLIPVLTLPRAFSVDEEGLTVHCLAFSKHFAYEEYVPEQLPREVLDRSIRLFGTGGYFGFTGLFWLPKRGRTWLLVANQRLPLLLLKDRQTGRTYLINAQLETNSKLQS